MSKEYQQIVSLADHLNQEEIASLVEFFGQLKSGANQNDLLDLSLKEKAEIHQRFQMIDEGETELNPWSSVKQRIFNP